MRVHLKLRNWRSIEAAELTFAPFTVVVGRNSSGKSNLVDALVFAREVATDADTAVSRRGGIVSIRRWSTRRPYDVEVEVGVEVGESFGRHRFVLKTVRGGGWRFGEEEVEIRSAGVPVLLHRDNDGAVAFDRSPVRPTFGPLPPLLPTTSLALLARQFLPREVAGDTMPPLRVHTLHPVPELMRVPQPPSPASRLAETGENVTSAFQKLRSKSEVVKAMQRIVPGLLDIGVRSVGRYLTLQFIQDQGRGRRPEFAATEMSDGALRALAVLVAAQQLRRNEMLIIEEPEVNLHPGASDVVYDVLKAASHKGAVLVTTHSPELLDRARDDEILVCDYEDGVSRIGPLSSGQREILRGGLYTAAELMRTEELRREGAEPAVVDGSA